MTDTEALQHMVPDAAVEAAASKIRSQVFPGNMASEVARDLLTAALPHLNVWCEQELHHQLSNALNLVAEQAAEIEALKHDNAQLMDAASEQATLVSERDAEIDRLKAELAECQMRPLRELQRLREILGDPMQCVVVPIAPSEGAD